MYSRFLRDEMLFITIILDDENKNVSYGGTMPLQLAQQLIQEIIIQERMRAELAQKVGKEERTAEEAKEGGVE